MGCTSNTQCNNHTSSSPMDLKVTWQSTKTAFLKFMGYKIIFNTPCTPLLSRKLLSWKVLLLEAKYCVNRCNEKKRKITYRILPVTFCHFHTWRWCIPPKITCHKTSSPWAITITSYKLKLWESINMRNKQLMTVTAWSMVSNPYFPECPQWKNAEVNLCCRN